MILYNCLIKIEQLVMIKYFLLLLEVVYLVFVVCSISYDCFHGMNCYLYEDALIIPCKSGLVIIKCMHTKRETSKQAILMWQSQID